MAFFKKNAYFSLAVGIALLALILFLLIVGYAQIKSAQQKAKSAKKSAKIQVLVDSDAIASLVERVGGDAVRVETAPRGVQASDLDKATRARLAATKVVFLTKTANNEQIQKDIKSLAPDATIVNLRDELDFGLDESDDASNSSLWTSPDSADTIVPIIAGTLSQFAPDKASVFAENAKKIDDELSAPVEKTSDATAL